MSRAENIGEGEELLPQALDPAVDGLAGDAICLGDAGEGVTGLELTDGLEFLGREDVLGLGEEDLDGQGVVSGRVILEVVEAFQGARSFRLPAEEVQAIPGQGALEIGREAEAILVEEVPIKRFRHLECLEPEFLEQVVIVRMLGCNGEAGQDMVEEGGELVENCG